MRLYAITYPSLSNPLRRLSGWLCAVRGLCAYVQTNTGEMLLCNARTVQPEPGKRAWVTVK